MTTPAARCCPCPPAGTAAGFLLCDCPPVGDCVQFIRVYASGGGFVDTTLDRVPYTPTGTVGSCCDSDSDAACASPLTPVAVAHLCLADGTPIVVVVQRDCDGTVSAPGWVNLATGVHTAGLVPADAAPCDSSADTAGSTGRIALCDVQPGGAVVGFLRAIDGDGTVTDTTITGLPYAPTGTVQLCEAITAEATAGTPPCESPTTPITTTGLCLADGTPIATVAQRDCDGVVSQSGWIQLTTGAFTAGLPPAGSRACGAAQSIQVSGVFCDMDPDTGEVFALVLVEYSYAPDGSIDSVRIVLAADGTTYVLQGVLSICPGSGTEMDVETQVLCLVDAGGVLIAQVIAEYGYDSTTGARLFLRFTNPTTGAVIVPPVGATVLECAPISVDVETERLCVLSADGDHIQEVIAEYGYDTAGVRTISRLVDPTTGTVVVPPVGATVGACTQDTEIVPLCDYNAATDIGTAFLRHFVYEVDGSIASTYDTTIAGAVYVPAGDVRSSCGRDLICYTAPITTEDCDPGVLTVLPVANPVIVSAAVEANPNGFLVTGLANTFDGSTGNWATITTNPAGAMPGLVLRYNFAAPSDLTALRLFNQYGGIHTDFDGIGAATLTVYDITNAVLWAGPLVAMNGGAAQVTSFGGVLEGAASFTLSNLSRNPSMTGTVIGFREIDEVGPYRAQIVWNCPGETITADVEGVSAGITYDGVNLTQTNGPHTFTFSSSLGSFEATIETNNPAAWSTTAVSDLAPVTVLSGNGSLTTSVTPALLPTVQVGWLNPDGTVTDVNTGLVVPDATIVPCVAAREPDHVVTTDIIEMCDAGTGFLRQVRLTRDGTLQITDTTLNGRIPYAVSNQATVTTGPCVRERLADVCAERGLLLQPVLVGFTPQQGCLVTTAANPTATWTGPVSSLEFTQDAGPVGGAGFRLVVNGVTTVNATAFLPAIPNTPATVSSYVGTALVGGITVTAELVSGVLARNGTAFAPAGRMRFTFSPDVTSVQIQTAAWPNSTDNQICAAAALPAVVSNPQPLTAYRNADGTVTYYTVTGDVVLDPVLLPCGACCMDTEPAGCENPVTLGEVCYSPPATGANQPLAVTNLLMQGAFFNDAAGEDICTVVPAPTSEVGWAISGACRNPTVTSPTLTWAGPIQTVAMEYGSAVSANLDGGVNVSFSATETGPITWPTNNTPMTVGEVRTSNLLTGGRFARLTYVSGPANGNAPRQTGGATIGLHLLNLSNDLPVRFRLDMFGPGSVTTEVFAHAAVTRECDGTVVYTDLRTGTVLDPALITIGDCPDPETTDTELLVLCDDNGPFVRHFVYGPDGAVASTVDTALDGVTGYTPAGAVAVCGEDPVPLTVQSQARVFTDAGPVWTPGTDVAGTPLSVTAVGLAGTWTVTDSNGTVSPALPAGLTLTWSAEDPNTLQPPQSIAAAPGGQVIVTWTQR